jgi:AraC-type DNA-binding domain-containing proteins
MKYFLLTIALLTATFIYPSFVWTQSTVQHQKDSLRRAISEEEGDAKLKTYNRLAALYQAELSKEHVIDTIIGIYDEMDAEAVKQNNITNQTLARVNKLIALSNARMYDEFILQAPAHLDFLLKNEQWKAYYQLRAILSTVYTSMNQIEQALNEAQAIYEHAKAQEHAGGMGLALRSISKIYTSQRRFTDAEKCLQECIKLLQDSTSYFNVLTDAYYSLLGNFVTQKRYDDAIRMAAENGDAIRSYEERSNNPQSMAWRNLYLSYVDIYRQSEKYDEAEIYVNKVDSITHGSLKLYEERAQILYGKKRYAEALEMINKEIEQNPTRRQPKGVKLMILIKMGEAQAAHNLFSEVIVELDSVRNADFNARLDEIHTQYEVSKHIAEKERNFNYFLFSLGGCALLIVLLGCVFYYNRIITRKNRFLYEQINEQRRFNKETEQAELQIPVERLSRERKLYLDLQRLMTTEKLFTQSDINRNYLADRLGTNRQYLIDAITQETGLNFSLYIADLRLQYSLELLSDEPNLSLDAIAIDSGYGSYSSFFRAFAKKYGITPSDYRKFSAGKELEK